MTVTKRTDELQPGDVVIRDGYQRTIAFARWATEEDESPPVWDVRYIPVEGRLSTGAWSAPDEEWTLAGPSPLDLAVQRAQEMADYYEQYGDDIPYKATALSDLVKLLDLFRAAR